MSNQINKSVLVTTAHFSRDAKEYTEKQNTLIDLFDVDEFYELLKCSAKRMERILHSGVTQVIAKRES